MPPRRRREEKPLPRRLMRFWWRFLAVALVLYVGYTIWLGGAYRSTEPFMAGQCEAVAAPPGPEDMAHLADGAIVSSQDRRNRSEPGGLYFYDMSSRPGRFSKLELPASLVLHPHGISLFTAPDGQMFLHVINHRSAERHTVEIFSVQRPAGTALPVLRHRGSVSSDLFVHPNGIAAAGPESFYLTNDRGPALGFIGPRWTHMVENLLQLARSTVVYHDGRGARVVAEDIAFANGIEISADGGTVLVGSTQWRMLLAFTREPQSGMLLRSGSLALPGGADNIRRDTDGNLWVAAHPNAFAFIGHAMDAGKESPSMILRLARDSRGVVQTEQAFGDPGTLISGASVGLHRQGRLLIGAVFQPTLLDCLLDETKLRENAD
jgi:arylesterase/paraoxonase